MKRKRGKSARRKKARRTYKNTAIKRMPLQPQKLCGIIPVVGPPSTNVQNYVFCRYDWGSTYNPYGNYGVNNTPRWQQVSRNWDQMIITGFKLKWIPTNVRGYASDTGVGTAPAGVLNPLLFWEDIDTQNIGNYTDNQILIQDNNWMVDPSKTFTVFRNNRPLAA